MLKKLLNNLVVVFILVVSLRVLMDHMEEWVPAGLFLWRVVGKLIMLSFIFWGIERETAKKSGQPYTFDKALFASSIVYAVIATGIDFLQKLPTFVQTPAIGIGLHILLIIFLLFALYKVYKHKNQQQSNQ